MNNFLKSYWTDKSVLITGASSGLGWAITEALAPYKVKFGLLSRRQSKMEELTGKLRDSSSSFWFRACDVRDRRAVFAAVQDFREKTGRLDVAWVNSGVGFDSSQENWDWEGFESCISTNLNGAIYTIQACLEVMIPQEFGTIAGIGSAASMRGVPMGGVYSLTKISLEYFIQSKASELPDIQFTIIHPGFVDTPINQDSPNRFWLLTPDRAAQIMIKAVAKKRKRIIYPFRMSLLYRLIHNLPISIFYWLARRMVVYRGRTGAK